eukprot:10769294-Ditylum_brightwellii.AAC.1
MDSMWVRDLLEDKKKFVIAYYTKIRYRESTDNLDVPSRFKAVLNDSKNSPGKRKKVLRCKVGFNISREKEEDETKQEES